jgi:hypothetical protein
MKNVSTEIDIAAPAERVWDILADFDSYETWNPFIQNASGLPIRDQTLKVQMKLPGSVSIRLRPRVLTVEPERELRWKGRFLIPGLFDGEHSFRIESLPDGTSRLSQSEDFSGILVPFLGKEFYSKTRLGFEFMNEALKLRAERPS